MTRRARSSIFAVRCSCEWQYTALLVLGGVEKLSWDSETRHTARTVWNAVASVPMNEDPTINLRLFFHPPPS